jgi:tetratricopeptide (TPR) repeat protein
MSARNQLRQPRLASRACALAVAALASAALAGCSGGAGGVAGRGASGTRALSGSAMLMQVRAAGQVGVELDVQPLRDPQVEDLRASAGASEARGDYAGATQALARALQLSPDDPDLLQWQAEMYLVGRDWAQAHQMATQSWQRGPKLGGLCRRNWTTIQLASEARGDASAAVEARQRVGACAVAPPTRL